MKEEVLPEIIENNATMVASADGEPIPAVKADCAEYR
jgi:hypothetical protein